MTRIRQVVVSLVVVAALTTIGLLVPKHSERARRAAAHTTGTGDVAAPAGPQDLDATIERLQAHLRAQPDDWRASASLGLAYLQQARVSLNPVFYPKAEAVLRSSLKRNKRQNFQALVGMGALAGARHDFAGALRWGRRAVRANRYNAYARAVVGDAYLELGRYADADVAYQKMVDLRPGLSSYARVSYDRELHGDYRGAVRAMRMAADAAAGSAEDASWANYQLGDLYFSHGHVGEARRAYEKAHYLAPTYYLPRVGLAKIAAARGKLTAASHIMSTVVEQYPSPQYVMTLGDLYGARGDVSDARAQYRLVRVEQRLFASNGVIPDVEITLFYADHGIDTRSNLARARVQYRQRPSVRVADAYAWALYSNHRYAQAVEYSHRALRLGTTDALYFFHAGMIARAAGDNRAAVHYLRLALETNPNFSVLHAPQARAALRSLQGES